MIAAPQWAPDVAPFARLLQDRVGLSFPESRQREVEKAVRRAMRRTGAAEPDQHLRLVRSDPSALDVLVSECTVGETYFFRDPAQIAFLRRHVIPDLAHRRPEGVIRAWSAGCASGEEAYTLVILLREAGLGGRSSVLGTDVARERLERAREASYSRWSLRGLDETAVRRYFTSRGKRFFLAPEIRAGAEFRHLNLSRDPYPGAGPGTPGMDVILCRNVLIYMDPATVADVARRLLAALAPGGWLLLGASDPPLRSLVPCESIAFESGVAYRTASEAGAVEELEAATPVIEAPGPEDAVGTVPMHRREPGREDGPPPPERQERGESPAATIRDLADRGLLAEAGRACAAALEHDPDAELLELHSTLLLQAGQAAEAARVARRALYLDPGYAIAHLGLGRALAASGDPTGARRAFRNALELLERVPPADPVDGSGGVAAGRLSDMVRGRLRLLETKAG